MYAEGSPPKEEKMMEAGYKIATPRKEVRKGRSFNPDEFAIHLEQVIANTAPEDYRKRGMLVLKAT